MTESREGFEIEAARVSSEEVRSMPMVAAIEVEGPAGYARARVSRSNRDQGRTGPVPGRMVLQDEGGAQVTLDLYASGVRTPLARVQVRRDTLALYALDLLRAGLRR